MKFSFIPLLFLCITIPGMAQFQLGPVAGLNISKIHYSSKATTDISYHNINGSMVGLNVQYTPAVKFNVQLEGAFSQKGFEVSETYMPGREPGNLSRNTFRINYLDFMALGEYSINNIMNINIGGNFGTKIGEAIDGHKGSTTEIHDGLDIGLIGGLKFYMGQFFVRTIYQYGINPIDSVILTNENGQQTGEADIYNRTFQVAVGYYF